MTTLITLNIPVGGDAGPFNLYSNTDGYTAPFATGISAAALTAGYTSTVVPNGTTIIRVVSAGVCTNYIDITINLITTTTTTSSSSTSTTTTTTTVTPTTTTTTTEFIPNLNSGSSSIQANPEIEGEGCDSLDYPYTPASSPLPPSLVAFRVTNLSVIWSDIEYVEIVSVTDDPNMVITYDGNVVAPAMQFIPATDSTWQYPLSITIDTFSCINTSETWEIRVKLTGYPISNIADATINFLTNPFCPDCVSTTTTTSTSSSTTTTTTTSIVGDCYTITYENDPESPIPPPPSTLYVRYVNSSSIEVTEQISGSIATIDNGDGTSTGAICVYGGNPPICVFDDGIDPPIPVSCNEYTWILGGSCTSGIGCLTPPLIPCVTYEATLSGGTGSVGWTDCDGVTPGYYELVGTETYTFCALENTASWSAGVLVSLISTSCTTGECIEFNADGGIGGGTVNYNDCFGNPQSFTVGPEEISQNYCGLSDSISEGGTLINILGSCGI